MKWLQKNLGVDGSYYLKGIFGLSCLPSDQAKKNVRVYESAVEALVKQLAGPTTSFWALQDVARSSKPIVIKPWRHDPAKDAKAETHYMAYGEPDSYADATATGEFAKTTEISDLSKSERRANIGTGKGSSYTLYFTPYYVGESRPAGPGYGADEVLLHELIHGLNSIKGNLRLTGGAPDGFDGLEEFTAILITNLYSSQTGRALRYDHRGHDPLPQRLRNPETFYSRYRDAVRDCDRFHSSLTSIYKNFDARLVPFNPFRYC
jgi:hypothetical protein